MKKTEPNMRLPLPSKLLLSDIEIIKKQIFYSRPFEKKHFLYLLLLALTYFSSFTAGRGHFKLLQNPPKE